MSDLIMDSGNIAEIEGLDYEESEGLSDLTATKTEKPETMDFHIQMNGYTMADFETMVVNAAAQQLLGGQSFKREIQEKANELAGKKLNDQLERELKDLMSMVVTKRGSENVTLRQMVGMEAKDYLTDIVDSSGKVITDSWGRSNGKPRIQYIAQKVFREAFQKEMEQAFKDLRTDLSAAISAKINAAIEDERKKIGDALGYEIAKRR